MTNNNNIPVCSVRQKVGNGDLDHAYWGRHEDMTMPRPAYQVNTNKPGSDVAGGTAAALAAGYLAFKDVGMWH